jgi:hypothetical protein
MGAFPYTMVQIRHLRRRFSGSTLVPEKINVFSKNPNKMGVERWGKKSEKGGGR